MNLTRSLTVLLALAFVAGLGVLGFLLAGGTDPDPLEASLATVGAHIEVPGQPAILRAEAQDGRLSTALVAVGGDRLRLRVTEGLDAAAAAEIVRDERYQIANLFEDRQAPYPGELSNTLKCPENFRPVEVTGRDDALGMVGLYANDRLTFGGCSEDLLRYKATVGFFHDPAARRLFRVEYFTPMGENGSDAADVVRSFRLGGDR